MKFRIDIMVFTVGAIVLSSFGAIFAQEIIALFPVPTVAPGFKVTMVLGAVSILTGLTAAFPTKMPRYGGAAPTSAYVQTVLPFCLIPAFAVPAALWMSHVLAGLDHVNTVYPVLVQTSRLVCGGLVPWCLYWAFSVSMEHRRSLAWERLMHPHEHTRARRVRVGRKS